VSGGHGQMNFKGVDRFKEKCKDGFVWIWVDEYVCFFWVDLEGKVSGFGDKFYES